MSYHRFSIIQGRAVTDKRVSNAQLRTLTALGMYADKDGWCFPSQSTIGEDLGKSRQTVNEDIAALDDLGYIEKDSVILPNKQLRMRYRLLYDVIPTGGVSENRQGVSELPDSNDSSNDPSNNTANGENQPLSIENQIYLGIEKIVMPDEQESQYKDTANLIAMGMGVASDLPYALAYTFMKTRGIIIPQSKIKGQRKVLKEMMQMGVMPEHIREATEKLIDAKMTVTDLYSVSKTAIALANPAPENYSGAIDGV